MYNVMYAKVSGGRGVALLLLSEAAATGGLEKQHMTERAGNLRPLEACGATLMEVPPGRCPPTPGVNTESALSAESCSRVGASFLENCEADG
jgi:hypothetical protein